MMFTDKQLQDWKTHFSGFDKELASLVNHEEVRSLLKRMEVAENCIEYEPENLKINAPEDAEVLRLCERIGFGAVMSSAARQWQKRDALGAFTVGGCIAFVKEWRKECGK